MRRLIIPLSLLLFVVGCGPDRNNPFTAEPEGHIIRIEKEQGKTVIWVQFAADHQEGVNFVFYASDTCKIGQVLHLSPVNH